MSGNKREECFFAFVRMPKEASEWSRNGDGPDKNRLVLMPLEVWLMAAVICAGDNKCHFFEG